MPWRNGGGTTTELVIEPASGAPFLYRVSIADVASDGPFSRFDGCDRHIMLIDGAGMTLDAGPHGRRELRALEPYAFSGDWDVSGILAHGPVRDFNLIVDRARAKGSLAVVHLGRGARLAVPVAPREACILHVLEGSLTDAGPSDTLVLDAALTVEAHEAATLAVARVAG